jgi:hypothetical protein
MKDDGQVNKANGEGQAIINSPDTGPIVIWREKGEKHEPALQ